MPKVSKKKQRSHGGSRSSYPLVSPYREKPRPGVDLKIDEAAFRESTNRTLAGALRGDNAPDVPINVRGEIKTRASLPYIPNPQPGDVVSVTLYKEIWCYYNNAWHCTVAPEEAHQDPERKDLLIKCWAWGP